jgi:hypothetical protein
MQRHTRLLLVSLAAMAILGTTVGTTTAGRLSLYFRHQFRIVWSPLNLSNTITSDTVRCPVTLEGSFHSASIRKVVGALIGYVTRAFAGNTACTGGRVTVNMETLPWHLRYGSFTGTLPVIETVTVSLVRASFTVNAGGNVCKASTTAEAPSRAIITVKLGLILEAIRVDESARIPLVNGPGGVFCGLGSGILSGTGTVRELGSDTEPIIIKLI